MNKDKLNNYLGILDELISPYQDIPINNVMEYLIEKFSELNADELVSLCDAIQEHPRYLITYTDEPQQRYDVGNNKTIVGVPIRISGIHNNS